ncbi:hypothetical protein [Halorubellus sp. PRR65]|uniref:hypothetical protein n=1 Tax=Halorubellus sp. PRR65 TaxID=3098148 RepID=UPI002B256EC3|nr:hypothetical protein [Halorubellus sp. PRR65]
MSTDPAFTVEWTVPPEEERGDGAPSASSRTASAECDAATATQDRDRERRGGRDPADLPPAPVLAARVDQLRSDRDAAERRLDAVRGRYETMLAERDAEIRELREESSALQAFVRRVRRFL